MVPKAADGEVPKKKGGGRIQSALLLCAPADAPKRTRKRKDNKDQTLDDMFPSKTSPADPPQEQQEGVGPSRPSHPFSKVLLNMTQQPCVPSPDAEDGKGNDKDVSEPAKKLARQSSSSASSSSSDSDKAGQNNAPSSCHSEQNDYWKWEDSKWDHWQGEYAWQGEDAWQGCGGWSSKWRADSWQAQVDMDWKWEKATPNDDRLEKLSNEVDAMAASKIQECTANENTAERDDEELSGDKLAIKEMMRSGVIPPQTKWGTRFRREVKKEDRGATKEKKLVVHMQWAKGIWDTMAEGREFSSSFDDEIFEEGVFEPIDAIVKHEGGHHNPQNMVVAKNYAVTCLEQGPRWYSFNTFSKRYEFLYVKKGMRQKWKESWLTKKTQKRIGASADAGIEDTVPSVATHTKPPIAGTPVPGAPEPDNKATKTKKIKGRLDQNLSAVTDVKKLYPKAKMRPTRNGSHQEGAHMINMKAARVVQKQKKTAAKAAST